MATDVERLVVSLEASAKKFENAMNRAAGITNQSMSRVEKRTEQATRRIESLFAGLGSRIKAGFAGILAGLSVQQVAQFADQFTKVQNALKVTGLQGQDLTRTYQALYAAAQRQGAPLEAMATLYGRLTQSQKELNVTTPEMLRFTEGVAMALRVQGTDAQAASGALMQLGQALAGGVVRAEEFNSINEAATPILKAVAAGMVETGGSVAKLRELVNDGKVSSEAFFRAFEAGMPMIEQQAARAGETTSQAWERVQNSLVNLVGALDNSTDASKNAAASIGGVASAIDTIAAHVPGAINALGSLQSKMTEIGNHPIWKRLYEGAEALGLGGMNGVEDLNRFDQVFGAKTSAGSMAGYKPNTTTPAPAIKPIRNADYPVSGGGGSGGKGGGKSSRERVNEYEREIEAIQRRTRALDAEKQTIGLSAGETAKAEAAFKLLEAAKEANVAVTPELKAQIDSLAAAYGEATQKIEDAREAQEAVADAAREVGNTLSDAFKDAILEGEKLNEVGRKLLKTFASKLIDSAFSGLFGGSGSGGGLLGSLLGMNPTGRAAGGQVKPGVAYTVGESGRETFVPTTPGRIVPHGRGGGGVTVHMAPTTIHAPGGDPRLLAAMLDQRDRAMVAKLPALIRNAQQRGQLGR